MRTSPRVFLAALVALLLTVPAASQDRVTMKSKEGDPPVIYLGNVTHINAREGTLGIRQALETTIFLTLENIEKIDTADSAILRDWNKILKQRHGEDDDEGGGRGMRKREEGDELVYPSEAERREIESEIKLLGYSTEAEDRLVAFGRKATHQLLATLSNQTDKLREAGCRVLGRIGDRRATPELISRVEDAFDGVRREAVIALRNIDHDNKDVVDALIKRAREERVVEVMKAIVGVLGEVGRTDAKVRSQIIQDSYDANSVTAVYYNVCRALMGDHEIGDQLERQLQRQMRDDVFIARALASITMKRDQAIDYLVEQLRATQGEIARETEIISALCDITGRSYGYLETKSMFDKAKAKKAWIEWWQQDEDSAQKPGKDEQRPR